MCFYISLKCIWKSAVSLISTCQTVPFLISIYFLNKRIRQIHDHSLTSLGSAVILVMSSSCKLMESPYGEVLHLHQWPLAILQAERRVFPNTGRLRLAFILLSSTTSKTNFCDELYLEKLFSWNLACVFDISDTKRAPQKNKAIIHLMVLNSISCKCSFLHFRWNVLF